MNKRIGSTAFAELLPDSIASDPKILAAAQSLDSVLTSSIKSIPNILVFARLANDSKFINPVPMLGPMIRLADLAGGLNALSPEILDLLAWQLHVESYDAAISLQARREMIQASLILHRRNGTPWSVRHALETLLRIPACIRQWFEYGGDPYFFRVRLNISGVYVDLKWLLSAFQIVMDYKNVRSWLEWLETYAIIELEKRTGIGVGGHLEGETEEALFAYANRSQGEGVAGQSDNQRTEGRQQDFSSGQEERPGMDGSAKVGNSKKKRNSQRAKTRDSDTYGLGTALGLV